MDWFDILFWPLFVMLVICVIYLKVLDWKLLKLKHRQRALLGQILQEARIIVKITTPDKTRPKSYRQ